MAATCASYHPSTDDRQRFWAEEHQRQKSSLGVPQGLPNHIRSPLAWTSAEVLTKRDQWTITLQPCDIEAIDKALADYQAQHTGFSTISASTFQLPNSVAKRLHRVSNELYKGVGFTRVTGLDPAKYTAEQIVIIYAGVAAHICPQRGFVDHLVRKDVIGHIVNVQHGSSGPKTTAPAFSNTPLSFHTDGCEIMGFCYLDIAEEGGETVLSSSWQTYNDLAKSRPEVLHTLAEPWILDTMKSYDLFPPRRVRMLERMGNDKVLLRFSRHPVLGWQRKRNPDLPAPTLAQLEALDAVHFVAAKNSVTLPAHRGDLLFVNDMALMHARTGFREGSYLKRHILKMFLRDPDQQWSIPESIEQEQADMYGPNRDDGGRTEHWQIQYEPGFEEKPLMNG